MSASRLMEPPQTGHGEVMVLTQEDRLLTAQAAKQVALCVAPTLDGHCQQRLPHRHQQRLSLGISQRVELASVVQRGTKEDVLQVAIAQACNTLPGCEQRLHRVVRRADSKRLTFFSLHWWGDDGTIEDAATRSIWSEAEPEERKVGHTDTPIRRMADTAERVPASDASQQRQLFVPHPDYPLAGHWDWLINEGSPASDDSSQADARLSRPRIGRYPYLVAVPGPPCRPAICLGRVSPARRKPRCGAFLQRGALSPQERLNGLGHLYRPRGRMGCAGTAAAYGRHSYRHHTTQAG